jgi:hypothetical protein
MASTISAQDMELGKVTKAELEQLRHPIDTTAPAAILFKNGKTTFKYSYEDGFVSSTEVSVKIKIYKKEGLSWANFKVPYYVGYKALDDESIEFSKAQTYNLENGKIVKTKVSAENQFKEKISEFWNSRSITFPNARVGSVLEFRYILKSQNLAMLPDFQFQYQIPVDAAYYRTEIPEYYLYQGVLTGYVKIASDSKLEPTAQSYQDRYRQTGSMTYNQVVTDYAVYNVPALIEEDYVDNIKNYYGKLDHELQVIRFPDTKPEPIATTWEAVAKSIYNDPEFGKEVEKYQYFAADLPTVVVNKNTDAEKLEAIFDYVKNRMSWDENLGYSTRKGVEKAYADRTGNVAEINLMLVSMLRMAGLQANPVLLSTRENGKAPFPNRTRFNSVIAAVTIDNKLHLLDASYKFAAPDLMPLRNLNSTGRMIQKGGIISEVNLMPVAPSSDNVSIIAAITPDGGVTGQLKQQYTNYRAYLFRDSYIGSDKANFVERQEQKSGLSLEKFKVENETELTEPVTISYNFTDDDLVEVIGDKMYVSPLLFLAIQENPFKQEDRQYPVDFIFPFQEKYNITIHIPDGYTIEFTPAPVNLAMSGKMGSFKYIVDKSGNKIQLSASFDIAQPLIPSGSYETLKDFFKKMISKQTEKIILKKV